MIHVVSENLFLDSDKTDASQAVRVADGQNTASLTVNVLCCETATPTLAVTVQTSNDLENWESADFAFEVTVSTSPSTTLVPTYVSDSTIRGRYVRVRYGNGSGKLILNAMLSLYAA